MRPQMCHFEPGSIAKCSRPEKRLFKVSLQIAKTTRCSSLPTRLRPKKAWHPNRAQSDSAPKSPSARGRCGDGMPGSGQGALSGSGGISPRPRIGAQNRRSVCRRSRAHMCRYVRADPWSTRRSVATFCTAPMSAGGASAVHENRALCGEGPAVEQPNPANLMSGRPSG
jgi:hypothetical protein